MDCSCVLGSDGLILLLGSVVDFALETLVRGLKWFKFGSMMDFVLPAFSDFENAS